jgi:hypothetical protein
MSDESNDQPTRFDPFDATENNEETREDIQTRVMAEINEALLANTEERESLIAALAYFERSSDKLASFVANHIELMFDPRGYSLIQLGSMLLQCVSITKTMIELSDAGSMEEFTKQQLTQQASTRSILGMLAQEAQDQARGKSVIPQA